MKNKKHNSTGFSPEERNAMRAFIQRAEVRLSTMHRVAGSFIGGAGLLVLFPIFVREGIIVLSQKIIAPGLANLLLTVPFLVSLFIPLWALFLLLRDLVRFYYVGHTPGMASDLFNPRFALSAISFSPDESEKVKLEIENLEYSTSLFNFLVPFSKSRSKYLDGIIGDHKEIIPTMRTPEALVNYGVLTKKRSGAIVNHDNRQISEAEVARFGAALGLAGFVDRSLVEETAKSEVSLARHALNLRRLVLRYMKALLMFIFTTLTSFALLAILDFSENPGQWIAPTIYSVWSVLAVAIVRQPIKWIYEQSDTNSIHTVRSDIELQEFEKGVRLLCGLAGILSLLSLYLTLT